MHKATCFDPSVGHLQAYIEDIIIQIQKLVCDSGGRTYTKRIQEEGVRNQEGRNNNNTQKNV